MTPTERIMRARDRYRKMASELEEEQAGTAFWRVHGYYTYEKWTFAADILDAIMQDIDGDAPCR